MVKRRLQLVALLCCFLIGLSGCSRKWAVIGAAAAAVGTTAYFYVKGDLKRNYEAPMDKTWQAAVKSIEPPFEYRSNRIRFIYIKPTGAVGAVGFYHLQ